MSAAEEMAVLREAVGFTVLDHVVALRVEGDGAFALLDRLSTAPLYVREGQMRHTLFLNESGTPFADVYVASDDAGYLILAEGPSEAALLEHMGRRRAALKSDVSIASLGATHELWGCNGPYAWEVVSALLGPSVLGMTYLTLLNVEGVVCLRGGKTGEYGYDLLVPRDRSAALRRKLDQVGEPREMKPVGLATLDQAAQPLHALGQPVHVEPAGAEYAFRGDFHRHRPAIGQAVGAHDANVVAAGEEVLGHLAQPQRAHRVERREEPRHEQDGEAAIGRARRVGRSRAGHA